MIADAASRVAQLDLTAVKARLLRDTGISRVEADLMEAQYRNFLILCLKHPNAGLTPSKFIDAFWHAHAEDHRKYRNDCFMLAGDFLDHDPNIFGEEMERRFTTMVNLYISEFGEDPRQVKIYDAGSSIPEADRAAGCAHLPCSAASCGHSPSSSAASCAHGPSFAASCGCAPRSATR
jgi:hypothetical protein